jgi:hypothetical protein
MALCVGVIADYNTATDAAQGPVAAGVPRRSKSNAMSPLALAAIDPGLVGFAPRNKRMTCGNSASHTRRNFQEP